MGKWKLQRWSPDTCDSPPCEVLEWWDAEATPEARVHILGGYERVCTAHADPEIDTDILQDPWDGKWRDRKAFVEYQKAWFRHLNYEEWTARTDEAPPESIRGYREMPSSPGEVAEPPPSRGQAMQRVRGWAYGHNGRKNLTQALAMAERVGLDVERITLRWEGHGDSRVLYVHFNGQLTQQQRNRVQNAANLQFGTGTVVIEG